MSVLHTKSTQVGLIWSGLKNAAVLMWPTPQHEVSVHPTLFQTHCYMKCQLLRSRPDHSMRVYGNQSLPFVVEQIKYSHAFVIWHISCANTWSELAFASDFAIPVALAELSDWLITDVYFVVRELSVIEWFIDPWLNLLMFSSLTDQWYLTWDFR